MLEKFSGLNSGNFIDSQGFKLFKLLKEGWYRYGPNPSQAIPDLDLGRIGKGVYNLQLAYPEEDFSRFHDSDTYYYVYPIDRESTSIRIIRSEHGRNEDENLFFRPEKMELVIDEPLYRITPRFFLSWICGNYKTNEVAFRLRREKDENLVRKVMQSLSIRRNG